MLDDTIEREADMTGMGDRSRRMTRAFATVAVCVMVSGCAASPADKSGGETVTLSFATIDGLDRSREFADAIEAESDGRLRVDVQWTYADGAVGAEARLVEAIAAGELDGGWPSTRAFAVAGIPGLAATEAPLVITNYEAAAALAEGDAGTAILAELDDTGIVGLGLAVGPLRRPFAAAAPLLGPEDWAGKRFQVYGSETQDAAVRALGGVPVDLSFSWIDEVRAGTLDGAEFDVRGYWENGHGTEAGNVTSNVVLWPKIAVLALSQKRWETLTEQQREWIRAAAARTTAEASSVGDDEDLIAQKLCDEGIKFFAASPVQYDALKTAVRPVVDALAADETTAAVMEIVRAVAEAHPGVADVQVPEACRAGDAVPRQSAVIVPDGTAAIAEGVYRVEITEDDVADAGLSNGPGFSGTWTMEIVDGTYTVTCRPLAAPGHDCGNAPYGQEGLSFDTVLEAGQLRGDEERVVFVYDATLHSELTGCDLPCYGLPDLAFTWSMDGTELRLVDEGNASPDLARTLKPWTRIG